VTCILAVLCDSVCCVDTNMTLPVAVSSSHTSTADNTVTEDTNAGNAWMLLLIISSLNFSCVNVANNDSQYILIVWDEIF